MEKDIGASAEADRATRPSDQAPAGLGDPASVPSAIGLRRTISAWETAPRDGTPFHILNTLRFNPLAKRFEALCHTEEGRKWRFVEFGGEGPTMWLRLLPLPYDLPTSFAFTLTYTARRLTLRERISKRLFSWLSVTEREVLSYMWSCASAIEARRATDSEAGVVADDAQTQVQSQTPHGDS